MDGYTLASKVKLKKGLCDLQIILQTSLNLGFQSSLDEKVGADNFIAKFNKDELATAVQKVVNSIN